MEEEESLPNRVETLGLQVIELVSIIVTKDSLYMIIKYAVFPLINALAHYMLFTRE